MFVNSSRYFVEAKSHKHVTEKQNTYDHIATLGLTQIAWKSSRYDSLSSRSSSLAVFTACADDFGSVIVLFFSAVVEKCM